MQSPKIPRVLIVEDTFISACIYQAQIKRREPSFDVSVAVSMESAIEEWRRFQPDIMVLDMSLPDSTAQETACTIKAKTFGNTCIMAMSADPTYETMAREAGAEDFMPKIVGQGAMPFIDRLLHLVPKCKRESLSQSSCS